MASICYIAHMLSLVKEKSEILQQVDELTNIKNELSEQVSVFCF